MKVRDLMTPDIQSIRADQTLQDAAEKMKTGDLGLLPVYEGDRLTGVITDRDITVRAVAEGRDPRNTRIADVMTRDVATCAQDDDAADAAKRMKELQVRRLLVLDPDKKPVGIVSLGDFATERECAPLAEEALAAVCQPAP